MAPNSRVVGLGALVCACFFACGNSFFTSSVLRSAGLPVGRAGVGRGGSGGLYMAKHVQPKATKKHVKNRPRKSRLSDRVRKPVEHPIEVVTNGNFPGAPPVWEVVEEGNVPPDTKASVIEKMASDEYDRLQAEKEAAFIAFNKEFEKKCVEAGVALPDEEPVEVEEEYVPEYEPVTCFG